MSNDAVNVDEDVGDDEAVSAFTSGFAVGRMAARSFDEDAVAGLRGVVTTGGAFKGAAVDEVVGTSRICSTAMLLDVVVDVVEVMLTSEDGVEIILHKCLLICLLS